MALINIYKPANDAEADVLQSVLKEHNVYSEVVSFHDTAYDGLYQSQYGWGVIKVSEEDKSVAQKIINDWKMAAPSPLPWDNDLEK